MLATVFTKTVRDRWKGIAIGGGSLALTLLFAMAVYRDIDISIYTEDLPEAFRKLFNISEDSEVGGLAYGAVYSTYGALTLAGITLAIGSASIAGEERNGTLGLLLGNPKSRTHVLLSKAASLILLALAGTVIMWVAGLVVPELLNVNVESLHIGALMVHMFVIAIFHGFLAMAIGAWTGRGAVASASSAGVMIVSLFAVGLLPLVDGLESLARVFPWYYYEGGDPLLNGISWGHLSVLLVASVVLVALAVYGVNRRDLRGQALGVT
ncbi:MAG: ABC transporter permease subunit, partial [Acidimicrobiia bacterium]